MPLRYINTPWNFPAKSVYCSQPTIACNTAPSSNTPANTDTARSAPNRATQPRHAQHSNASIANVHATMSLMPI